MLQETSLIPPLYTIDYPVKVMIRIFPDGTMEIFPEGMIPLSTRHQLPFAELANISQQLQASISDLAISNFNAANFSPKEMNQELKTLSELSNYAYQIIFNDSETQSIIEDLPDGSSIEIVSENFILPWQLLYPADINQSISCNHFWGMKYIIFNTLIGSGSRRGPHVLPNIFTNQLPHIGLLANKKLPAVEKFEIPYLEKLHENGTIHLKSLRALDPEARENELKVFCNFWQEAPFHIAHFACHARYDEKGPNLSEITLSDDFSITLQDMVTRRLQINSNPLVIMNACETNNLNPLYSSHFASQFLERGARGVVATECRVPDSFAASFIRKVYEGLFAGKTIGESLLESRQYFWEKYNNPSGLLYTIYGPSAIRLT